MPVTVVIGSQWGDEGKGKIVDLLSAQVDIVARYQGGANAGHTICIGDVTHVLHLIPSGIFHAGVQCVIGNGVVIDPVALMAEVDKIQAAGHDVGGRLFISKNAHLILPYHKRIEQVREQARNAGAIGTTGRGIGPSYVDKFDRMGIRVGDLLDRDVFRRKLSTAIEQKNAILKSVYGVEELDARAIIEEYVEFDRLIAPYAADTTHLLGDALADGKRVLAEGAQGSLLDIDFGTYPFVTSSSPTAGGACTGLGIPPTSVDRVIGIVKAYSTRVGNGPFPTELEDAVGQQLRKVGHEFGATTGRPRRCGWLDLVALNYASRINGFTDLAITKLDVLSGLETLRVASVYKQADGSIDNRFPCDMKGLEGATPVYQDVPGWSEDITEASTLEELPDTARDYLDHISSSLNVPISFVSTGPKRSQTIPVEGVAV
ncbi:MAG: adenylosuccinate synthase [Rhodothermales bacterium]|jgi:adenylosuccinate synthase